MKWALPKKGKMVCNWNCSLYLPISDKKLCETFSWYILSPGPNLDLLCVWQSDAVTLLSENYAKLYFDAKHLEKRLNRGWWNFWHLFFKKKFPQFYRSGHDHTSKVFPVGEGGQSEWFTILIWGRKEVKLTTY